jgi:hypothetical protein
MAYLEVSAKLVNLKVQRILVRNNVPCDSM